MKRQKNCLNGTNLHLERFNVVDVDVSVTQSVNKVAGLEKQDEKWW